MQDFDLDLDLKICSTTFSELFTINYDSPCTMLVPKSSIHCMFVSMLTHTLSQGRAQKTCRFLHDYLELCSLEHNIDTCLDNPINLNII